MDIRDKHDMRMVVKEELDERFPEKYCPECKQWHPMVKLEKYNDAKQEYMVSFKCLCCSSEFVEELRKV